MTQSNPGRILNEASLEEGFLDGTHEEEELPVRELENFAIFETTSQSGNTLVSLSHLSRNAVFLKAVGYVSPQQGAEDEGQDEHSRQRELIQTDHILELAFDLTVDNR